MPPDGSRKRGRPSDSPVAASHVNVLRGVTQEFDRTLPFWRCFTDLKSTYGHPPIVQQRTTTIHFREACSSFKGVDVVWAITKVTVRVQTGIAKRQKMRIPEKGRAGVTWRGIPYKEVTWRIGTMHFVHQNMNGFSGEGYEKSFHIQSVVNYDCPAVLQCVAGTMVSFWLLLYSSVALLASDTRLSAKDAPRKDSDPDAAVSSTFVAREEGSSKDRKRIPLPAVGWLDHAAEEMALQCKTEDNRAYVRAARQLAPHSTSRILVLGMGGNSMAVALRLLLGPHAEIHVVEIDASVFRACKAADTLLESDTKQFVYVESAEKCLPRFVNNYFHFIFMDLFEPLDATMVMTSSLVGQCHAKLSFGGMLVVNDHQLPSPATVTPWVELFGDGNVSLVNLNGWKESVLVCMKEGDVKKDGKMLQCNRIFLDKIYSGVYDRLTPGLLPPPGWIKKALKMSSTNKAKSAQCFES